MDCSTPGFPVLHYLLEFAQTHVHWVGDTIRPSHPRSSPSPPAFSLSQHQGLFLMLLVNSSTAHLLPIWGFFITCCFGFSLTFVHLSSNPLGFPATALSSFSSSLCCFFSAFPWAPLPLATQEVCSDSAFCSDPPFFSLSLFLWAAASSPWLQPPPPCK